MKPAGTMTRADSLERQKIMLDLHPEVHVLNAADTDTPSTVLEVSRTKPARVSVIAPLSPITRAPDWNRLGYHALLYMLWGRSL